MRSKGRQNVSPLQINVDIVPMISTVESIQKEMLKRLSNLSLRKGSLFKNNITATATIEPTKT